MNHPPAYEEYSNQPRPKWNWDTPDGNWVGIWGYDWADQLAIECSKITDEFEHEVWQPDLRADKIYSAEINKNVFHKLFPAKLRSDESVSLCMKTLLESYNKDYKYIFHIGSFPFLGVNKEIIDSYEGVKFVLSFHGEMVFPINSLFLRLQRNLLKKVYYFKQHKLAKFYFKKIHYVTYPNDRNLKILNYYYKGPRTKVTMGISLEKFKKLDKNLCRKLLGLPMNKKILITVSRLYNLKQIDKLIEVLKKVEEEFLYIIVGHGRREYENYLYKIAELIFKADKIIFTGYKHGDELLKYLNSADLFLHPSLSEGASVAVMEAMASGLPIFCTDTGNTAEVLKQYGYGCIVGRKNYRVWEKKLKAYLKGELKIEPLPIQLVKKHYDWQNIANKFLNIYKEVSYGY